MDFLPKKRDQLVVLFGPDIVAELCTERSLLKFELRPGSGFNHKEYAGILCA